MNSAIHSVFTVPGFATLQDIAPILAIIPQNAAPVQLQEMKDSNLGPTRSEGAVVIDKIRDFWTKSDTILHNNLTKLDNLRQILSAPSKVKYLGLKEIAEMVLPQREKIGTDFPPFAMYALHIAILRADFGITPLSSARTNHLLDHIFEVLPREHMSLGERVAGYVREYLKYYTSRVTNRKVASGSAPTTKMSEFVRQAREVVLESRVQRPWTTHGIIHAPNGARLKTINWPSASQDIIAFLELWSSYSIFNPSSRFHAHGALILRALELYDGAQLDKSTAWTFLQELDIVPSWEVASRYQNRLPHTSFVRGGGLDREAPKNIEKSKRTDIAAGARKDWSSSTILCIDGPSTVVVDDGISLERTENPDEFWVHVHIADPASVIKPNSELCKYLELIPASIYLPGHYQAMLPSELGEQDAGDYQSEGLSKKFSLQHGAPTLTFSAKVNLAGELVDYKIEPGVAGEVVYLDPTDVSEFCGEPSDSSSAAETILTVGTPPPTKEQTPARTIVTAESLDESGKGDILQLYQIAEALKRRRLGKGAWPHFFSRPSVSVSFHEETDETLAANATQVTPDPYVEIKEESSNGSSVVSNLMVLANEVAAQWCSARGIPIPYRRDVKVGEHAAAAFTFATKEIYPLIEKGIKPTMAQIQQLGALTGSSEISAEPGPFFVLGLDMYAKATSPLRRFSDLLVHWQVHAALAFERKNGRALDPKNDDLSKILPFSPSELTDTLSLLQVREGMARAASRGTYHWILQAVVRGWLFENKVPKTLRLTVDSVRGRHSLKGTLDLFQLRASMDSAGLDGKASFKNVQAGDQFEVELADVNVYYGDVKVKALHYLGQDGHLAASDLSTTEPTIESATLAV